MCPIAYFMRIQVCSIFVMKFFLQSLLPLPHHHHSPHHSPPFTSPAPLCSPLPFGHFSPSLSPLPSAPLSPSVLVITVLLLSSPIYCARFALLSLLPISISLCFAIKLIIHYFIHVYSTMKQTIRTSDNLN